MKNIAIILIVLGGIMMAITGFNIVTKKKVVDLGKVEISKNEDHPVQWSPIVGGVLLVAGIAMFVTAKKS